MVPNVRQSRAAAARLSSPLRGRVLEARGREEPDQPGPDRGESRDIAETLADVLYREALRNGIDPLEYES
jgi:hypothetical protein